MTIIAEFVKRFLLPASAPLLILGLTIGVVCLYQGKRLKRWGRVWLTILAVAYWCFSAPLGATLLEAGLTHSYPPITYGSDAAHTKAIVVLGGGSINLRTRGGVISIITSTSALRAMEGARIYSILDDPVVIASGGQNPSMEDGIPESDLLAEVLLESGVPEERIILESLSQSTRQQAEQLEAVLSERGMQRFILVTSPIHMFRSLRVFRALGLDPIPGPSQPHSEGMFPNRWSILPSDIAMDTSAAAMREYLAISYYWLRGWLRSP